MPELDDVNDNVWELRDEVRELRGELDALKGAVRAYALAAKAGPHYAATAFEKHLQTAAAL